MHTYVCIWKIIFCPKEFPVLGFEGQTPTEYAEVMCSDLEVYYNETIPAGILSCEYSPV